MTTPKSNGSTNSGFPNHKWDVYITNLTAAGMHFQEVKIYTDSGDIDADVSRCLSLLRAGLTELPLPPSLNRVCPLTPELSQPWEEI